MATGNIISLQEGLYQYQLPPEPRDEKLIMNYNLKKEDQIWRRPEILDVKRMTVRERGEYIEMWDERWWDGMWIFIQGEPVWITGAHVDFLVFNKWDFGYAKYLKQQRFDFYYHDLVRKNPNSYGEAVLKCRRCGFTTEELEMAIYTLLEDENNHIAFQSSEHTKCIRTLLHPMIQAYLSRPTWMRAKFYAPNGKKPRNSLELISSRIDILNDAPDDFLGGTALAYPTVASAIDGYKKALIIMDELFKWLGVSPIETLDINKKCVVEYGINGKVNALSTMGDNDDVLEAVKEGCQIMYGSNPNVVDSNGRTTTGLSEWFVSAIHSADIPEQYRDPAYTKFGDINKDSAEGYVRGEVNKHPVNSKQRVYEMRRLPLEKKHGLMAAGGGKEYFPELRMQDRLDKLNELPRDRKPYVIGNLTDPDSKGRVFFEPDEAGIWKIAVQPYFSSERDMDTRNRWRRSGANFLKPINPEYVIGYDPIKFKKKNTTSNHVSKACLVVWKKFDYFGSNVVNEYCALMLHRPDDPKDAHYEAVKACRFYGAPINVERNIADTDDVFLDNGMEDFLLKDKHGIYGIYTNDRNAANGVLRLTGHFSAPKTEEDKDQVECYPFEEGLIDFMNFDLADREKSHITMATIMCEYGADQLIQTNVTDNSVQRMLKAAQSVFPPVK